MTQTTQYTLDDLRYLMARLRDPLGGCPWDLEQNFHSIVPHTLEEAYEVADAIEREDFAHLPDELGDLLFQVVYYAQMAQEQQRFDFTDVVHAAVSKLIRRHPHVFPDGQLYSTAHTRTVNAQEVENQWQAIKAQEKNRAQASSVLADIPLNLPALPRAVKLQKQAAKVGFDWVEIRQIFAKIQEEISEVQEAIEQQNEQAITHELGDVLFAVTNLARFLRIDPEQALRLANQRFTRRFTYIEQRVTEQGRQLDECKLEYLDGLWEEAKRSLS